MSGHIRRSRDGCWTCRKRKKKCDGEQPTCYNCNNLRVHCEGYSQRLLWEDAEPRIGMRRRGPAKRKLDRSGQRPNIGQWNLTHLVPDPKEKEILDEALPSRALSSKIANRMPSFEDEIWSHNMELSHQRHGLRTEVCIDDLLPSAPFRFITPHPLSLSPLQSLFLDHYLNNFSLKYPTYLDPSNPFLSTLVPLALRNTTVMCAVLAIGGIQTGLEARPDVKAEILALKGRTLHGCRKLLQRPSATFCLGREVFGEHLMEDLDRNYTCRGCRSTSCPKISEERSEEEDLILFASVMMLMVHDKLSGETYSNLRPHLKFAHHFERRQSVGQFSVHYKFLRNIFLYNDLLASIASGSPTLRDYGQNTTGSITVDPGDEDASLNEGESSMLKLASNRFYLPILLSRITNGSDEVTLVDIDRWDGNMTWLPSFSSASTSVTEVIPETERQTSYPLIANEFENRLISEIYRNAARVFYFQRQRLHNPDMKIKVEATYASSNCVSSYDFQIQHFNSILLANLRSLPIGSAYDSSLLFPIGIAAIEIRDVSEKAYVLSRLQLLERRFQLNHFRKFRNKLSAFWEGGESTCVEKQFACDAILLG